MRWAEIRVETTAQAQDAVANLMMENGCGGTAIQGDAPVIVSCYLPVDDQLEQRLLRMESGIKDLPKFGITIGSGDITITYAEEQDWAEAWKQFFQTIRVGERIVIKPVWEKFEAEQSDIIIEIDPGMAFGTGTHATTQLCLRALEKYIKPRQVLVDFGTGSGILAIAAAKLEASLVIAFDCDDVAVRAARSNIQLNDMEERIEVHRAESPAFVNIEADLVTANIITETITAHAEMIAGILKLGGSLIASGITTAKALEVEQALRNAGFDIAETLSEGEWVAIIARKSR